MSSETTNLHLVKPTSADTADIGIINRNMDIIDDAVADRLPLSGGTVTGWLNLESSNFDRDAAAPSSDQWGNSYVRLVDKDGEIVGQLRAINRASGIMSCRIGVFGENTSGTEVSNTIELQVAKDGTQSYYITNPAAFCSALNVGNYYYQDNSSGTSVASSASATTTIASISVPPGFYIIRFAANFASNASGFRTIGIGKGSTTPVWRYTGVQVAPVSGVKTYLVTSNFSNCTDNPTTLYGVAQQNSGSSLAVQGIIEAIRIK